MTHTNAAPALGLPMLDYGVTDHPGELRADFRYGDLSRHRPAAEITTVRTMTTAADVEFPPMHDGIPHGPTPSGAG
jgi:hypothetical protein